MDQITTCGWRNWREQFSCVSSGVRYMLRIQTGNVYVDDDDDDDDNNNSNIITTIMMMIRTTTTTIIIIINNNNKCILTVPFHVK